MAFQRSILPIYSTIRAWLTHLLGKQTAFRKGPRAGTVEKYEGCLEAYWETGWEGQVIYALSVEGLGRPFFLESGQRPTIYAEDGSVLWSGTLRFVKRRWWDQHNLPYGIWSDERQAGVSYAQWMEWFAHKPPLKATVEVQPENAGK